MSDRIDQIFTQAQKYFAPSLKDEPARTNPLPYLIAKQEEKKFHLSLAQELKGNDILRRLAQEYFAEINAESAEFGVYDWDTQHPKRCVLIKQFMENEITFYQNLLTYEDCDPEGFIKKRYPLRFFSLELPLNTTQSIHLHQYVSGSYQTKLKSGSAMNIFYNLFEQIDRMKIIDYSRGFMLKPGFDFLSFFDSSNPSKSFSVIHTRKWFEKLHDLIEEYQRAYEKVSELDCIDLSELGDATEDTWRKCDSLLKYPDLNACMSALNDELTSGEQTISKDILAEKGIKYEMREGMPVIIPETLSQFKVVIKILNDKIVQTQLLRRIGLSDYIEEIQI